MYPKGNLDIPASHGHLEAIVKEPHSPRQGVGVVCHPHPLGGGTMHNKVVFRAAAGMLDAGLLTVKFNFRGVGGSTGVHNEIEGGREDVGDVLEYVEQQYPGEDLTLAGFSFGSRTGLEVGFDDPKVKRLISIGTPIDKYGDYDFLIGLRKPILFIHGDQDEFGSLKNLRPLIDEVAKTADTELVVFENCGHFFDEHLNELREAIRSWVITKLTEAQASREA
ncbi:MAG TPA: alpha/beta fold hydrolase [Pyrinomonadaceae bacterium]|nr:alpha/beta fold hydrolase [Chloracidobacterium sp.]MBP9935176.1 alpha/beta fold hydrolase [Pyrinomonadaceae bacterium]MBK7803396.1 alpha/beta fold hydrolase [Chloracidobacterium sp.]MBK9438647.1 alpha/beta fold hydrolase [Chloracidobacterium sp.]MBK9766703.1 alpha/beta fold hydrolase [Chloracidobacterium sp.]